MQDIVKFTFICIRYCQHVCQSYILLSKSIIQTMWDYSWLSCLFVANFDFLIQQTVCDRVTPGCQYGHGYGGYCCRESTPQDYQRSSWYVCAFVCAWECVNRAEAGTLWIAWCERKEESGGSSAAVLLLRRIRSFSLITRDIFWLNPSGITYCLVCKVGV